MTRCPRCTHQPLPRRATTCPACGLDLAAVQAETARLVQPGAGLTPSTKVVPFRRRPTVRKTVTPAGGLSFSLTIPLDEEAIVRAIIQMLETRRDHEP